MNPNITIKQRLRRIAYFFPIQLVWVSLKKNHFILLVWLTVFSVILENLLVKFGFPSLMLYPEYLNEVGYKSHLILGFACGGFIMAFNISSYIMNGFRFPFIATLSRPFMKYCINNFIIPVSFLSVYSYQLYQFQLYSELEPLGNVLLNIASFWGGISLFLLLTSTYFINTNKNIFKLFEIEKVEEEANPVEGILHKREKWSNIFNKDREWHVETYFSAGFHKISLARGSQHYSKIMLNKVFTQNYVNASVFEIFIILSILSIGYFRENQYFEIPSGASFMLLLTLVLMLISALYSWLKGWATTVFIGFFIVANFLSQKEVFNYTNYAYGMNYNATPAIYSDSVFNVLKTNKTYLRADKKHHLKILGNWQKKNQAIVGEKPKLIVINTSGGAIRSASWTFRIIQHLDSIFEGQIMRQTHLISGSSGGMIGAAYLREIYRLSQQDSAYNIYEKKYVNNISQDALNPLTVAFFMNDLFIRTQEFKDNGNVYPKDRGYALEKELDSNTKGVLNHRISFYKEAEYNSTIPLMILNPTIANDGRKLFIASQPVSFLTQITDEAAYTNNFITDGIEFARFFKNQDADSLRFMTALRMSATFPYIMPVTSLPSQPAIQLMDAGIRDNFGLTTSLRYLYTFREWIKENTSGVIILQLRDKPKKSKVKKHIYNTIAQKLSTPMGSFYGNWEKIQNYEQDELILYAKEVLGNEVDVINFDLESLDKRYISLNWHLTNEEKKQVFRAVYSEKNKQSVKQLKRLLEK